VYQLAAPGAWLAGKDLPDGLAVDAELRARILFTLTARGLASAEDIDALPRLDPVTGEVDRATCLAMQPDLAAKEAAWTVALFSGEPARIAQASAADIWVPGQEELMAGYRDRYFTEVLPALITRRPWSKSRLSRLLFPVTLVSEATSRPRMPQSRRTTFCGSPWPNRPRSCAADSLHTSGISRRRRP
jgi:aminopeptidase N